jgi:hypothetical protein
VGAGPSPEGAEGTALLVLRALQGFVGAAISLAVVVIVFFAAQPYALIDWPSFRQATLEQSGIARGLLDYPYTRQYLNTPAFIYQIWQTSLFGLGLPLGLLAFGGLVFIAGRGIFRPSRADWLLLAWVVPYFLVIGGLQAKYLRYMLPLVPFLCLFGAEMIWGSTVRWQRLKFIVGWLVVFLSLAYSLAFANVYSNHHTWLRASTWIYRNIPAGSSLAIELWDDALPTRMVIDGERRGGSEYRWRQMDLYAPDTPAKLDQLVRDLARSDYIVLASQRLYASIARLPDRYPITTRYYELLFGEKLGFRLVTFEATYPSLLGVTLMDDTTADLLPTPSLLTYYRPSPIVLHLGRADESFTVYDHPKPLVFQKAQRFSEQELHRLLAGE